MTLVSELISSLDSVLKIREDLGAEKHFVYILKRENPAPKELEGFGEKGQIKDILELKIFPSPRIMDYSHSLRLKEGGNIRQGDLVLKMISKNQYKKEDIDLSLKSGESKEIQRYYYINKEIYNLISITEDHCWFNIQVRKVSDSKVYLSGN